MTDHDPDQIPADLDPEGSLAQRWARLEPDERVVVALALTEMLAGTFASWDAWERFAAAAVELMPRLRSGVLSADELHEIALRRATEGRD